MASEEPEPIGNQLNSDFPLLFRQFQDHLSHGSVTEANEKAYFLTTMAPFTEQLEL